MEEDDEKKREESEFERGDKSLDALRRFEIIKSDNGNKSICFRLNDQCFNLKIMAKYGIFKDSILLKHGINY